MKTQIFKIGRVLFSHGKQKSSSAQHMPKSKRLCLRYPVSTDRKVFLVFVFFYLGESSSFLFFGGLPRFFFSGNVSSVVSSLGKKIAKVKRLKVQLR